MADLNSEVEWASLLQKPNNPKYPRIHSSLDSQKVSDVQVKGVWLVVVPDSGSCELIPVPGISNAGPRPQSRGSREAPPSWQGQFPLWVTMEDTYQCVILVAWILRTRVCPCTERLSGDSIPFNPGLLPPSLHSQVPGWVLISWYYTSGFREPPCICFPIWPKFWTHGCSQ